MEEKQKKPRGRVPKELCFKFDHLIPHGFDIAVEDYLKDLDADKYRKNISPIMEKIYGFFDEKRIKKNKTLKVFLENFTFDKVEFMMILKNLTENYIAYEELSFYYYLKHHVDTLLELRDTKRYFTEIEEYAIKLYVEVQDKKRGEFIYHKFIHWPIEKLVENIINTYKLYSDNYNFDELQKDTVSFLYDKLSLFDVNRGTKCYSYLGTIARHRLQAIRMDEAREKKRRHSYDDTYKSLSEDNRFTYSMKLYEDNFMVNFYAEIPIILKAHIDNDVSLSEMQKTIGECLIKIMGEWNKIEGESNKINKNLIFECLRNMTGYQTADIREAIKIFRAIYYTEKQKCLNEEYNPYEE